MPGDLEKKLAALEKREREDRAKAVAGAGDEAKKRTDAVERKLDSGLKAVQAEVAGLQAQVRPLAGPRPLEERVKALEASMARVEQRQ